MSRRPTAVPKITDAELNWSVAAHLSSFVTIGLLAGATGMLGPLIIWALKSRESAFIRQQAAAAVNFNITVLIAVVACYLTTFIGLGVLAFFVVGVAYVIFTVRGALAARRGEYFHYPLTLSLFK